MDLSPVNDFFSNIKDKLTNPFFGTLIIVWLTRNWELVYTIFNFDNNKTLKYKIQIIKNHISAKDFLEDLAICAWHAILFMLAGYIIIIITRAISMFVEHNVMPRLTDKIVSEDVISKKLYNELKKERDEYSESFEIERSKVRESSKNYTQKLIENEQLQNNLTETDKSNIELREANISFKKEIEKLEEENNNIKDELIKLRSENKKQSDTIIALNQTLNSNKTEILNTELNNQLWQVVREFFFLPKEITEIIHLSEETQGTLTFDRRQFNMQAYGGNIQQFLYSMQNANLGFIKTITVDKLIEFELYDDGRKFLNLLKLFKNFKTQFNYM